MKNLKLSFLAAALACLFALAACSSPFSSKEEMATITISLGDTGLSRVAIDTTDPAAEINTFEYELWVDGSKKASFGPIVHDAGSSITGSAPATVRELRQTPARPQGLRA